MEEGSKKRRNGIEQKIWNNGLGHDGNYGNNGSEKSIMLCSAAQA